MIPKDEIGERRPARRTTLESQPSQPAQKPPESLAAESGVYAVFDLDDRGLFQPMERDSLTDIMTSAFSARGYRTVPRTQLRQRIADEKGKGYGACFDEACQIELGKAMSARKSVSTQLIRLGGECTIAVTVYDLRSETTDKSVVLDGLDCSLISVKRALLEVPSRFE